MLNELLNGFHVLIVSDHRDLANLFAAIVTACGATSMRASSVRDAVEALRAQPHAVLLDVALEGDSWAVPVEANTRKIPVVALTLRCEEPRAIGGHLRALSTRSLNSTEMEEVCQVLHDAASAA